MLNGKQPIKQFWSSWIVVCQVTHVCQECSNFQDSKSIFIINDFKIFPIILWGQLNFGVLLVQRCFRFIPKEKLHFSLISSFYCCLVKGGWTLLGAAHRCGGGKKSHIFYQDDTWHTYTLTKEDQKIYINQMTYCLRSLDISIFCPEINKCCYIKKWRYRLYFDSLFLVLLTFLSLYRFS